MGPGSLRRAIERKSPMLLHRSIRTGSSIFATYRATGRSVAHALASVPALAQPKADRASFRSALVKKCKTDASKTSDENAAIFRMNIGIPALCVCVSVLLWERFTDAEILAL